MKMMGQLRPVMKYFFTVMATAAVTYVMMSITDQRSTVKAMSSLVGLSDRPISTSISHFKHQISESELKDEIMQQTTQHMIVKPGRNEYKQVSYNTNRTNLVNHISLKQQPYQYHHNTQKRHLVDRRDKLSKSTPEVPVARHLPRKRSDWTSSQEFSRRKRRLDEVCDATRVRGQVHAVYTHKSGVVYCFVPKAGCTFWKRVFTAAEYGYERDIYRISRNTIHGLYGSGVKFSSAHNETAYPVRLLVVRDPFSRLLSSYLDKIYLPDFWPSEGRHILRGKTTCSDDFMRNHFDQVASVFEGRGEDYSTCQENWCAKYLTFSEFVRGGLGREEPHWMPIHQICNPCVFNASHVVYMETFNQDARPILRHMGMTHILNNLDQTEQVNKEIEMLIDYHFKRSHESDLESFYSSCVSPRELAFRLWQTFLWKGYIDPDVTYAIPDYTYAESFIKEDLLRQVRNARTSGILKPEAMKEAHEFFKEKAYRSLPKYMFENLLVKFKIDFELFGYEPIRNVLYSTLYNGDYEAKFGTKVRQ